MMIGLKPGCGAIQDKLSQEASQGNRWDSRLGTPSAKQHCHLAKQQEEAKSKQTRSKDRKKKA